MEKELTYYCDENRHLICVPYTVENLHVMAEQLQIERHWFHNGRSPHYDIPVRRIKEITEKCQVVSSKVLIEVIRGQTRNFEAQQLRLRHYDIVRNRLRESTPTGLEPPQLSLTECILCEILGDMQLQINDLKARLDLPTQLKKMKK